MKLNSKIIIIVLGLLTIIGLLLICMLSRDNFVEANRLEDVFNLTGNTDVLVASYNVRYVALLYFLWFCLATILLWEWADKMFIHPSKRTLSNLLINVILTLLGIAIGITFALLQGNVFIMKYAYVYMLISIMSVLVLAYVLPLIVINIRLGKKTNTNASTK